MYLYKLGTVTYEDTVDLEFGHNKKMSQEEFLNCVIEAAKTYKPSRNTNVNEILYDEKFIKAMKKQGFKVVKYHRYLWLNGWDSKQTKWHDETNKEQVRFYNEVFGG